MPEEAEGEKDFADLSDKEIRELSEEFTELAPESISKSLGFDLSREFDGAEEREFEEEAREQIEKLLIGTRDALGRESDEERFLALAEVYNKAIVETLMGSEEGEEFETGLDFLIEQLRYALEGSRYGMRELGYENYYESLDDFAEEIVEAGRDGEVKEFFDGLDDDSQQAMLQRVMNPVTMEYYGYLEEHPRITDADEARGYADLYYELAELVGNILPQFIAVLQIVSGSEEKYDELKKMGSHNLLQILGSQKYGRFNFLCEGIDRELRNSIAHRDFKVDPIEEEIEFRDRGELVAELTYSEFEDEVRRLLALFNALWVFRLMVTFYRIQFLPGVIDELRSEVESLEDLGIGD